MLEQADPEKGPECEEDWCWGCLALGELLPAEVLHASWRS